MATQDVPAGPMHDTIAQQVSQQTAALLDQVFEALKQSLTVAIEHGFVVVLLFCIACLITTFFLKDVPFQQQGDPEAEARQSA
jgi:hypothetical protein